MGESNRDWARKEKLIHKEARKKYQGRRRAKATLYTMLGALIAFLISIFGGFLGLNPVGFYSDGSGSHSIIQEPSDKGSQSDPIDRVEEVNESGRIVVKGDTYIYGSESYDLEGIADLIRGLEVDGPIDLVDEYAVNKAFEAIEQMLNQEGIDYNIIEVYE